MANFGVHGRIFYHGYPFVKMESGLSAYYHGNAKSMGAHPHEPYIQMAIALHLAFLAGVMR